MRCLSFLTLNKLIILLFKQIQSFFDLIIDVKNGIVCDI